MLMRGGRSKTGTGQARCGEDSVGGGGGGRRKDAAAGEEDTTVAAVTKVSNRQEEEACPSPSCRARDGAGGG